MVRSTTYDRDIESNFTEYETDHIAIEVTPEPDLTPEPAYEPEPQREYIAINIRPPTITITQLPIIHPPITIIQPINVQIKTATGQLFFININPLETILFLKKQIYIQQDVSLDSQRIIFKGKQLEDHKRICDYNITNESILHIILRLRGGMFHKSSSRSDWISLNHLDKM